MTSRSYFALFLSFASLALASVGACSAQIHDGGTGGSTSGGSSDGGASDPCPRAAPANGDACHDDGLSCAYSADFCSHTAICTDGAWSVQPTDHCCGECPMSVCPLKPPAEGSSCSGPSSGCVYMVKDDCGNEVTEDFQCDGVWQKQETGGPPDCSATQQCAARGLDTCADDGKCKWLAPGCATTTPPEPLSAPGCYPTTDCTVSPSVCSSGELCEQVVINPCFDTNCNVCGASWGVCLIED